MSRQMPAAANRFNHSFYCSRFWPAGCIWLKSGLYQPANRLHPKTKGGKKWHFFCPEAEKIRKITGPAADEAGFWPD